MTHLVIRDRILIPWRIYILLVWFCCSFPTISSHAADSVTEIQQNKTKRFRGNVLDESGAPVTGVTVQI